MSTQPVSYMTLEEYFEHEEKAERPSEYYHGELFPMEDVTVAHTRIVTKLVLTIGPVAPTRGCEVFSTGLSVAIKATGLYTYPDVTIVCGALRYADAKEYSANNPKVIFEVESPTSQDRDMGKFKHYRTLPSLEEYFVVAQDEPSINQFLRQPQGAWMIEEVKGLDQVLHLRSLDLRIPLADIYHGVL